MDDTQPTTPLPDSAPPPPQASHGQAVPPVREPFYKRHGLAFAISTLVLSVVLLFGMVGVGAFAVGSLLLNSGSALSRIVHDAERDSLPPWHQVPERGGPGGQQEDDDGGLRGPMFSGVVRGTVTEISGSTWTIRSQRGVSVTVETDSSTEYGIQGQDATASDFRTGDEVIVLGTRDGDVITAARIMQLSDVSLRPPSTPGSSATPGS